MRTDNHPPGRSIAASADILKHTDSQKDQSQNIVNVGQRNSGSRLNMARTFLGQRLSVVRMRDVAPMLIEDSRLSTIVRITTESSANR